MKTPGSIAAIAVAFAAVALPPVECRSATAGPPPQVIEVWEATGGGGEQKAREEKKRANTRDVLRLGRPIAITFENLDAWRQANPLKVSELVLYLDGHPIAKSPRVGSNQNELIFDFEWSDNPDPSLHRPWASVLGRPQFTNREVRVQVGIDKEQLSFPGAVHLPLETLHPGRFWAFAAGFALLVAAFWVLARRSDVLRDGHSSPANGAKRRTYSLGRTQMAVWFFIVVATFLFIWIVTGTYQPLTPAVLGLIGISAGTALGATVIDENKRATLDTEIKSLDAERVSLEGEIASLDALSAQTQATIAANPAAAPASLHDALSKAKSDIAMKDSRHAYLLAKLKSMSQSVMPTPSRGFMNDILSDENGVSFHRFQIAVWTVVLAIIFVYVVYRSLAMPDFDAQLMALMGISSGTYLGFKIPEAA